jgi:ParB family chromosome partitioning protein
MPDILVRIPVAQIEDRRLPLRQQANATELSGMMRSIQRYGVIEPIIVTPADAGYRLVIGRRRLEACRRLGMETIPAIVRRVSDDRARELSFQSNLQVAPLNLADEVDYLRGAEVFHLSDDAAAERLGMSQEEVAVARRFSRLPAPIREAVRTGQIDERRALALTRLGTEADQTRVFRYIRQSDPPIEMLEEMIDRVRNGDAPHI